MKAQEAKCNVEYNITWILTGLTLIGLLGLAAMSLAAEGAWTKKADMPAPRWGLSASVVNGKIYTIGGTSDDDFTGLSTVEEYDPMTDEWAKKADMPTPRWALSASVVNGKIYTIGGTPDGRSSISTVEEYDPATDTWTKKADMPTPRAGCSTGVVDGRIYAIGGASDSDPVGLSGVEAYDPATDT